MSLQHIQKNSPRLLPKPAKFEKNPPNGYRVIRKTKCGAGGAGGARSSPIHKQASLAGRLITIRLAFQTIYLLCKCDDASCNISRFRASLLFQAIGYGGHFVFQNEAKILHRHVFITINIPCKFVEDIFINE